MRHALLLAALVMLTSAAAAQPVQPYSEVRIVVPDRTALAELAAIGEIDHVNLEETEGGLVVGVVLGQAELERVLAAGYDVEVLVEDVVAEIELRGASCPATMPVNTPEGFSYGSLNCFPTLGEAVTELDQMRAQYPDLITEKVSIGQSWEGRDIWMVRISAAADPESVPEALYTALHHAREPGSLTSLLFFMHHLLENYGSDEEVTYLLQNRALYFIPVLNPDGYRYVETNDLMWRKNRRPNAGGSFGVDLNRNYAYEWGGPGSSGIPSSNTYRGPYPFSEPETQALREWLQIRKVRAAYNYHTHGQYWLHPFGYTTDPAQAHTFDHQHFTALSAEITRYNGYAYGPAGIVLYVAAGDSDDWMYGELDEKAKIFAFTPEMGTSFWPSPSDIVPISRQALHPNLVMARFVGPYLALEEYEVAEADVGNGHLDPGEQGVVSVSVHNLGLTVADDARARVVATDPELGFDAGEWGPPFAISTFEVVELPPLYFDLGFGAPLGIQDGLAVEIEVDGSVTTVELGPFVVGTPEIVFEDPIEDASHWELGDWGLTAYAYSPPYALADSPGSNYPNNADNALTLAQPLDLSVAEAPRLRFMARWDIQKSFDYVQVLASTNGTSWTPLRGNHTRHGTGQGMQPAGQPGYDGTSDWWVQEEMSLAAFAGEPEVHLMWRLRSGDSGTAEGFFLDDVEVLRMTNANPVTAESEAGDPRVRLEAPFPNPAREATHLQFRLGRPSDVSVAVYDVLGRRVRQLTEGAFEAGSHLATWDARNAAGAPVAAGVYIVELRTGQYRATRQVAIVR